jgi:hypothetical protein
MKTVFGGFDHAYVINCERDYDRMKRVAARLNKLGIPFERFPALPPPPEASRFKDPVMINSAGCSASHEALLKLILERGHETALLLEDDVVFRDDINEWMTIIAPQLATESWDMFYLGLHLGGSSGRVTANLGRVAAGYHAHAYAVCRKGIPAILEGIERIWTNPVKTFDCFDDKDLVKLYTIPILAIQEPSPTIDRLAQYFSVFDGSDFERHCHEMQGWNSNWREVLAFTTASVRFEHLYRGGSLQDAAAGLQHALTLWPTFEAALQTKPGYTDAKRTLTEELTDERKLLDACAWFRRTGQQVWATLFQMPSGQELAQSPQNLINWLGKLEKFGLASVAKVE